MKDIQKQTPWTVSQIGSERPNIPKSANILSGTIANSMNGGHNRTIAWKQVMAGERHYEYRLQAKFRMLTPITPTYQNLKMTIRSYFVPNSRIWDNAEKYTAQKGGTAEEKIPEIPNLGGKTIPNSVLGGTTLKYTNMTNTSHWKKAWISSYIPRVKTFEVKNENQSAELPKISILPLRGRIAIYNDFERNKEFDTEITEYHDDTVSTTEWNSYLPDISGPFGQRNLDLINMRAKKDNCYYTDYRTELQGFELDTPNLDPNNALLTWANWESKISEARSEAENAQLNDWQIIAKIRGSKMLTEGKVQLIGQKTFNLNYAAITQNSYNSNENISEEFRVLGQQGAYSYTEVNIPLYAGMEFNEEGYVHIIATVSADTVFEKCFDRLELNVTPLDQYRPDLKDDKFDVLYEVEMDSTNPLSENIAGFKRRYSEYFKLNNIIAGDMTNDNYFQTEYNGNLRSETDQIETQKTFQFFESERTTINLWDGRTIYKKPWKDYTDIMINKNQAIMNQIQANMYDSHTMTTLEGQDQVFFIGQCYCLAELPIDSSIATNFQTWGEH